MLRNMVSSLLEHESVETTWQKAKEASWLADKMITVGKQGINYTNARQRAQAFLFNPRITLPKLFGELAERYKSRPGGYTRVIRLSKQRPDGAESAVLQLVDGPKDLRWDMTTRTVERLQRQGQPLNQITLLNVKKCTQFRQDGEEQFQRALERLRISDETKLTKGQARAQKIESAQARKDALEQRGERVFSDKQIRDWHANNLRKV